MTRPLVCFVVVLAAACGSSGPNIPTFVVAYHLTKSPAASTLGCDSLKYENADGDIITVVRPTLPWAVSFAAPLGNYVQAQAWVVATAGGQTAKLKVTWTISGVSTAADSSFGTSSASGAFSLGVARRQLTP